MAKERSWRALDERSTFECKSLNTNFSKRRFLPLGGKPTWRLERQALASEEIKRFSALTPLGQKHTGWIGTGNLSLLKRNALTTRPRLHIKSETLRFMKLNYKKEIAIQKICWERFCSLPTLVQTSAMQVWCRILMESVCKVVIYHPAKKLQAHVLWRCSSSSWGSVSACSP